MLSSWESTACNRQYPSNAKAAQLTLIRRTDHDKLAEYTCRNAHGRVGSGDDSPFQDCVDIAESMDVHNTVAEALEDPCRR